MSSKKKALYAGSFDPFTNGHLDICLRAAEYFDELVVLIAVSPMKSPLISMEQREKVLVEIFKNHKNISIAKFNGLLVDFAKQNNIGTIVRGLRPTGDFDNEFQMASMNRKLNNEIETVFFVADEKLSYISSSLVKEIYSHGGDISPFVPKEIKNILEEN